MVVGDREDIRENETRRKIGEESGDKYACVPRVERIGVIVIHYLHYA